MYQLSEQEKDNLVKIVLQNLMASGKDFTLEDAGTCYQLAKLYCESVKTYISLISPAVKEDDENGKT